MTHLWELKHPYYCEEGNYFSTGTYGTTTEVYRSWSAFHESYGDADEDMNLVFRWDWREDDDFGSGSAAFSGDPYYRNGRLHIYVMQQRKGFKTTHIVEVCRADEPAVVEYLNKKLAHLMKLWAPLFPTHPAPALGGEGDKTP